MQSSYRRLKGLALCATLVVALCAGSAWAQPSRDTGGLRVYDEQLRVALDDQMNRISEIGFDAGGWLNVAYFNYDDNAARKQRQLMRYSARAWGSLNVHGVHEVYFRGLLEYDHWLAGGNPASNRGNDFTEQVERAWYQFDLGQFMANKNGVYPAIGAKARVGRQFMVIGTGLTMSIPMDAIRLDLTHRLIDTMLFVGVNDGLSLNIDNSNSVANRQDRTFFGTQVTFKGFAQHRPFAYFFMQNDHSSPSPRTPLQSYSYDSRYLGLGSTGTLLPNLTYATELAFEWGTTYGTRGGPGSSKCDINAMAFDMQLAYTFAEVYTTPKVMVEYIYGSGDGDRTRSPTATVGGNGPGSKDTSFSAFGFRDTGIALAPEISNIHIWSVGGSFFPLEKYELFEKMEIGSKVFLYQRDQSNGAISDPAATGGGAYVGSEWDVYCNWRITSDLSYTARYGMFMPGTAYDGGDKTAQHFFYTGIVLSF
jgi:hypothetical protein